jgi:hypothetical protein
VSLSVNLFFKDPESGKIQIEEPGYAPGLKASPGLGGFESWRTELRGSEWAEKNGARFLTQLRDSDLYVENDQLAEFSRECHFFIDHCEDLCAATGRSAHGETVKDRLINYLNAIDQARAKGCGVLIW